jgi:hypothetical protein
MFEPNSCTGTFTGSVDYDPSVGPGGFTVSPIPRPGRNGALRVGHVSITIR